MRAQGRRQIRSAPRCRSHRGMLETTLTSTPHKSALAAHGREVADLAARVGTELGLGGDVSERLRVAGLFHDVGKLWIPASILEKDGPLTVSEWAVVRKHPENGATLLRTYGFAEEAEWVLHHHERYDGLGYPHGLVGEEIPLESRILALVDAWSAMRSERPYSDPLPATNARRELEFTRGEQFDPALVDVFLERIEPELSAGTLPEPLARH
jgi:putative nucleotidyltransferase with HDIG domain